jgi:serine/threonine-protein kinase
MAPEQLRNHAIDRRVDVFAMGIVLWEMLTGQRLFARGDTGAIVGAVLMGDVRAPSELRPEISAGLDAVVLKALASDPAQRFESAREMALALEQEVQPASALRTGTWVESVAKDSLDQRAKKLREAEETSSVNAILDPDALQRSLAGGTNSAPPPAEVESPTEPDSGVAQLASDALRRRRLALFAGGAVLLLGGLGLALRLGSSPETPAKPSVTSPPASVAAAPPVAPVAAPVSPEPARVVADLPSAAALPAPAPAAPAARKPSQRAARPASCNPPFVLDAQGRKRFKPECF